MQRRTFFWPSQSFFVVGGLFLVVGGSSAHAQELHPDWSQVWNGQSQTVSRGEMTVPEGAVIPVTLDRSLSSSTARVGDIVTADVVSRTAGDSEFPPGTRIGGVVSQADPASGTTPGVLDVDFQSARLPDGSDVPLRGVIASLDSGSVETRNGHVVARDGNRVNAWKAVGVGGAIGFVLGRLLKTRTLVPTILGAAGGYIYARSNSRWGEEARIGTQTTLGVRLQRDVSFADTDDYASVRLRFLEMHEEFRPERYGWNRAVCAPSPERFTQFVFVQSRPSWVYADPFDYYGFPLVPVWVRPHPFYGYPPIYAAPYAYPRRDYDYDRRRRDEEWEEHHRDARLPRWGDGVPYRPAHPENGGNGWPRNPDHNPSFFGSRPQPSGVSVPKPALPAPQMNFGFPRERPRGERQTPAPFLQGGTFSRPRETIFQPRGTISRIVPRASSPFGQRRLQQAPPAERSGAGR